MLRPYLPTWLKTEKAEFALEVISALALVGLTVRYFFA